MISVDEALGRYEGVIPTLESEQVAVEAAGGRILAESIRSMTDLPRFDQSAMDGYAIRAMDIAEASQDRAIALSLTGTAAAGISDASLAIGAGETVRILTGGEVPAGADTVIPQEQVTVQDEQVLFTRASGAGKNIRRRGEELTEDDAMVDAGQRCTPGLIAALIMAGHSKLAVSKTPRIAVFTTGDELQEPGAGIQPGEIHDSNGPMIVSWLAQQGLTPVIRQRLPDDRELIRAALSAALSGTDLIITSGGVSVGDRDYLIPVAESLGVQQQFWKVAQKPGKPIYFGMHQDTALLGLPGNPGAVLVGLEIHAARILDLLCGVNAPRPQWQQGILADNEAADTRRDRLLRMRRSNDSNGRTLLQPLAKQDSHMLSNLSSANTLVRLPASDSGYAIGDVVEWIPLTR